MNIRPLIALLAIVTLPAGAHAQTVDNTVSCERLDDRVFVTRSITVTPYNPRVRWQRPQTGNGWLIDSPDAPYGGRWPVQRIGEDDDGISRSTELEVFCTDPFVSEPAPSAVMLNVCVVSDPDSGVLESRVFIDGDDVRTDDCLYRYGVTQVFDGPARDLVPIFRHVRPGVADGHRLSTDAWPEDGETIAELLFYVHPDTASYGQMLYGYRAVDGGWTYTRNPLPEGGASAGYVEEVRVF